MRPAPVRPSDPTTDEPTLISRAAGGDTEAFAILFHRYHAMIHAFAYRLCLDPTESQDIAQETFIRAARGLGSFAVRADHAGGLRPWLYRIALNITRDGQRRRLRWNTLADEFALRQTRESCVRPGEFGDIEAALAALPEDLRRAIVLVYYEQMSHAEAAAVLGCAETTVSWRVFRARRRLRQTLSLRPDAGREN